MRNGKIGLLGNKSDGKSIDVVGDDVMENVDGEKEIVVHVIKIVDEVMDFENFLVNCLDHDFFHDHDLDDTNKTDSNKEKGGPLFGPTTKTSKVKEVPQIEIRGLWNKQKNKIKNM